MEQKKIVIVGAGHNGLVAAAYLAKAGHKVTVYEKRSVVGGCASSDTSTFPGFTISKASYLNSLFLPAIVRDLELERFGYKTYPRDPSSFTPLPDGRYLMLGPDTAFNQREIAKFSEKDAKAYPRYEENLAGVAEWVAGLMTTTPPNLPPKTHRDWKHLGEFLWFSRKLLPWKIFTLIRLMLTDPVQYLDSWFESDVLKATLLTDALIGTTELSGYVLLHHVMGEAGGARGVWAYQRGGMGGISEALRSSAEYHGAKIHCATNVTAIDATRERIGVFISSEATVEEDHFVDADIIVSNLDPLSTFRKLFTYPMDTTLRDRARKLDYRSASMKINLVLSGLPNFRACPGTTPGPQHCGTIHIAPSVVYVLSALEESRGGMASSAPILELTIPSILDDSLAPPGKHVMNIFLQFVPYRSVVGRKEEYFRNFVLPRLREFIANIDEIILGLEILAPEDLEREFGLEGGNIFHGALTLPQLFSHRPFLGMADYRTPISGLYLCGSGTHPGGGVTGAPGYNAVREILHDISS